ncbi:MAG: LEA type 2 family protein [Burkholderiales bacterium]|nr:LEA type 2 family protein [Burkholderiales bacterium]
MERSRRVWILGGAVALLGACAMLPPKVEPPSVTVSDLRIGMAGIMEQQYFVKLRIQNPNDLDLQVRGVSFELELNDRPFAKGVNGDAVTVPRFGSEFVEVEMVSSLTGILRQLGTFGSGTNNELRYRIKGRLVTSNAGTLAFDERGDLKLGAVPSPVQ